MPYPTTIKDCMRRKPLTVKADDSLVAAIDIISEYKLTGLTVTDEHGTVVGVLSEIDCIESILGAIYNDGDPDHLLVREAMTADAVTCEPGDSIIDVAQSMLKTRQRRRPVVNGDKLVGQVSSSNVLWALMEHSRRHLRNPAK